jgi:arginyl-tRNA--protein-N-Asp/Glu arginylyltransferase
MQTLGTIVTPPHPCSYRPDRIASIRYDLVSEVKPEEYERLMHANWRRFGYTIFRPECNGCTQCKSLRVDVARFRPSQSQKRARKANADVTLAIGEPGVCAERLDLYDRYHAFQSDRVGWRDRDPKDPDDYIETFVAHPYPTQEWQYRAGGKLLGVGYVDDLPGGPSAIYFYYDPKERDRSLGTFNVLSVLAWAAARGKPYVYLGYYVEGCRSLEYKSNFRPNQVFETGRGWEDFRGTEG